MPIGLIWHSAHSTFLLFFLISLKFIALIHVLDLSISACSLASSFPRSFACQIHSRLHLLKPSLHFALETILREKKITLTSFSIVTSRFNRICRNARKKTESRPQIDPRGDCQDFRSVVKCKDPSHIGLENNSYNPCIYVRQTLMMSLLSFQQARLIIQRTCSQPH